MNLVSRLKARARVLWASFRLTVEDWDKILAHQDGKCFICLKPITGTPRPHTDHDHKTGLVRGLLCSQCNRALGKAQDPRWQWTPMCFYRAFQYLTNPPATAALGREVYGYPGKIGTERYRQWVKKTHGAMPTANGER